MNTLIFGNFLENLPNNEEYLIVGFSPACVPLKQRWRNNGLSANFLAEYFSTFFPCECHQDCHKQAEMKSAVSYIANELLENAMKYTNNESKLPISVRLNFDNNKIIMQISNSICVSQVKSFQSYIETILNSDPMELYLNKLEQNAIDDTQESGLGYLTMINDYDAKIGWKFEAVDQYEVLLTTMVHINV
jgi:hypothetical protein